MVSIEFINRGLIFRGETTIPGVVVDVEEDIIKSPQQQFEEYGKVFYVQVGSKYADPSVKEKLRLNDSLMELFNSLVVSEPTYTNEMNEIVNTQPENPQEAQKALLNLLEENEDGPQAQEQKEEEKEEVVAKPKRSRRRNK